MNEVPSLCQGFNPVSVKAGDIFKIELLEGGAPGTKYALEVVTGNATPIGKDKQYLGKGVFERTFTFLAEEAGDVEVRARATMRNFDNRVVAPLSFRLTVQ